MANFAAMTNISHSPRSSDRHASFARQAPLRVALCALLLAGCTTGGPQGVGDRAGRQDPATVAGDVSSSAVLRIADSLRASGDLSTAISFYRRAIQIDPNQVKPYIGLGETLLAAGYANQAAESFRAALSMAPDNADATRGLGMTLVALDKPTEAAEMLNKSINTAPSPRAFSALGVAENLMGNTAAATEAFKHGLALAPEDLDLLNNYGLSQALAGDYDGAIATLHRVATDPRASSRNRLNLALVLGLAGRSEDAAQVARIDLDEKAVRSNLAYYAELRALSPAARAQAILRPGKPLLAQTAPASTCDAPACAPPVIGDKASAAPAVPVASTPLAAAAPQKPAAGPAAAAEPKTAAAPKPAKHAKKLAEAKPAPEAAAKPAPAPSEAAAAPKAEDHPAAMAADAKAEPAKAAAAAPANGDKPAAMASEDKAALRSEAAPMEAANAAPAKAVPQQVAQLDETPAPAPSVAPARPEASLAMNMPAKRPDAPMTSTQNASHADQAPEAAKWLPGPDGNTIPATATAEASPGTAQMTPAPQAERVAAVTTPKPETAANAAPATGPTVVAAAPAHPAGKHGSWIQLATFRSEQNAKDQLKATMSGNQDLLHGLPVTLRRVDLGAEKGIYYLLRVGPMESTAQAHDLCAAFKDRKIDCVISK